MPTPRKNERRKSFINRCVKQLIEDEGREPAQANAICNSIWKDKHEEVGSDMNYFRADVTRGIKEGKLGVDRENEIIKGFAVVTKGITHDRRGEFDDAELNRLVKMGNEKEIGLKSRFGHPNMSVTALGTFLGRVKNFRKDGDVVRADLHIDETAHDTPDGDLANYVMSLAESDPDAFGSSMVINWEPEFRFVKDDEPEKDEKGDPLPPFIRVSKFREVDIVDHPAANNGMFGTQFFDNTNVKFSAEMTAFLDKFLNSPDAIDNVMGFLQRYLDNRDYNEGKNDEKFGVVPYRPEGKTDVGRSWDGSGARKRLSSWAGGPEKEKINWKKYQRGFAVVEGEIDNFGNYKLPHHDIIDSNIVTVWRGVTAAMGALLGARGGVDASNKKGIYNHLAKHYRQYDKEPPEFGLNYSDEELKQIEEGESLKKEGIVGMEKIFSQEDFDTALLEKTKELQSSIEEKDAKIAEFDSKLQEKDNLIKEKEDLIIEKDNSLKEKDSIILEKENKLSEQESLIKEKDDSLSKKDEIITEKENIIKKFEAEKRVEEKWSKLSVDYDEKDASEIKGILLKSELGEQLTVKDTEILLEKKVGSSLSVNTLPVGKGASDVNKDKLRRFAGIKSKKQE